MFKQIRNLYDYMLMLTHKKHALTFLAMISFCESIFFPLPPDIMLIPMVITRPRQALRIAFVTTLFSTLGGLVGYAIGLFGYHTIAEPILHFYHYEAQFEKITHLYLEYGNLIVTLGAISPIPYKIIAISSGFFNMNIISFTLISIIARGGRFFILAILLKMYGAPIQTFIDKYFNILVILFCILLVGGFVVVKWIS